MADEQPPIAQNWRLLIVAFALGLVVMVVYNMHIAQVRKGSKGEMVKLLKSDRDIDPGKTIPNEAALALEVPKDLVGALGDVIPYDGRAEYVDAQKVQVRIHKDTLIRSTNFKGYEVGNNLISAGMVSKGLQVDPNRSGALQGREGIWVNVVLNMPNVRSGELVPVRVLKSARVVGIGDSIVEEPSNLDSSRGRAGQSGYRKVTIELTEKMAGAMDELVNKAVGPAWLEMLANRDNQGAPSLTPEAEKLLKAKIP